MRKTKLERAIDGMEDAGWRLAGMSRDKIFFDRKIRDPKTGKPALEWREFAHSAAEIEKFLGTKKKSRRRI